MRNKKDYKIINPIANQERFSHYYCYYLFWVAVGYYLWKKILTITGYRFHPTDFELLHYYLHNKNLGRDSLVQAIAEVEDICGLEPWQLPGHSNIHSGDQVWYFFYRPCFKYQNSSRINRTTNEGYWKPTGKPRKIMARDIETEIGKKRTLVFYKGRVSDNIKIKTDWIMHEYELNATLHNQTSFVLCKLKRKFGEGDISCIEECQSSHYLPPNLGNYIANNENEAEAARCLTDKSDPIEMLALLKVLNDREGLDLEHRSIEWWNSYLLADCPEYHDGSGDLPLDFGNHVAENATPDHQLLNEIPIEPEVPQDQSGTNEQDSNLGNLVPADERSNQHNLDNDGSTMPSNSKNDTAEDSVQMDKSDPIEMLAQLKVLNDREGLDLEHRSIEWWNSYLLADCPEYHDGSGGLPLDFGNHVAENATPDHQLLNEIPIESEVPQDQSGTNEQDSNLGNLVPADERSNQHNLDNDGSTMPSNSKNDTAEDSVQMDLSVLGGPSTDELFAELEALLEDQGNRLWQIPEDEEVNNGFDNQCSSNEEQGMMGSPIAMNLSRKRSRTDHEGFDYDI